MKAIILATLLMGNSVIAGSQNMSIPLNSFTCDYRPSDMFNWELLSVTLPKPVGSLGQDGILRQVLFEIGDCQKLLSKISQNAENGVVNLVVKLDRLSTIKVHEGETSFCEMSQEETVSIQEGIEGINLVQAANTRGFQPSKCP